MTDTSDKREDIVYIYVNSFEYKDKTYETMMGGHPHTGRIYRALYDKKSELYRILFDSKDDTPYTGLVVKDLVNEDSRWASNFEVLSDETIIEKDVTPEDFFKLSKWKETGNKDIDRYRIEQSVTSVTQEDGITKVSFEEKEVVPEEEPKLPELALPKNVLDDLKRLDPNVADAAEYALIGMLSYLESSNGLDSDLTRLISYSGRNGKGANIGITVDALTEYLQNDSYMASGNLIKAVYYLLRELARINKND